MSNWKYIIIKNEKLMNIILNIKSWNPSSSSWVINIVFDVAMRNPPQYWNLKLPRCFVHIYVLKKRNISSCSENFQFLKCPRLICENAYLVSKSSAFVSFYRRKMSQHRAFNFRRIFISRRRKSGKFPKNVVEYFFLFKYDYLFVKEIKHDYFYVEK